MKTNKAGIIWRAAVALVVLGSLGLSGCGGGGGSYSAPPPPATSATAVTGTAASGNAISNATITLKDSAGKSAAATTGADGSFSLVTTGLTPPYVLQVTTSTGVKLYSVSADANAATTINVTPLTDTIIRAWYALKSTDADTAFADPVGKPAPSPATVQIIANVIMNVMQLWLNQAGVDTSKLNLITTPFVANHTGVDAALDKVKTYNPATGVYVLTDGTTTQNTTVTFTAATGTIGVATTTTSAGKTSSSSTTSVIPTQTAQDSALAGITSALGSFASTINAKGTALAVADVLPFLDPGLLDDGLNQSQFAANVVSTFTGGQSVAFSVQRIKSLDPSATTADVVLQLTLTQNGQTSLETNEFVFKNVGGKWLFSGNQQIASFFLQAQMEAWQGAFGSPAGPSINVNASAPQNSVSGATVSGGTVWSGAPLTAGPIRIDASGVKLDFFFLNSGTLRAPLPAAGTAFALTLTKTIGGTIAYTKNLNAFTNDPIAITNLTASTIAAAKLGTPLTVNWTLPTTYAVSRIKLHALAFTGSSSNPATLQCDAPAPVLSPTATSGAITIPAMCNGLPVLEANINLTTLGVNGEASFVGYMFK